MSVGGLLTLCGTFAGGAVAVDRVTGLGLAGSAVARGRVEAPVLGVGWEAAFDASNDWAIPFMVRTSSEWPVTVELVLERIETRNAAEEMLCARSFAWRETALGDRGGAEPVIVNAPHGVRQEVGRPGRGLVQPRRLAIRGTLRVVGWLPGFAFKRRPFSFRMTRAGSYRGVMEAGW